MTIKKVSLRGFASEFFSRWIGFDNQFGRTVKELVVKPGYVLNSYLQGNRVRYLGPLSYVLIMTALLIISFYIFSLSIEDFLRKNQSTYSPQNLSHEQIALRDELMTFIAKYFRFFTTITIPFFALAMGWFFREKKFNYMERLAITTFLASETMWFTLFALLLFSITDVLLNWQFIPLSLIYYGYAFHQLFEGKHFLKSLAKAILTWLTAAMLLFSLSAIIGLIIGKFFSG
ncbi:MAG: DUF3667 domain-containing protein [Bacteroidota bacterium]